MFFWKFLKKEEFGPKMADQITSDLVKISVIFRKKRTKSEKFGQPFLVQKPII